MREMLWCRHCGVEWEVWTERGAVYYAWEDQLTRRYPLRKGFCRACALDRADHADRVRFIEGHRLEAGFFGWLAQDMRQDDAQSVWRLLNERDPELMETRLAEYVSGPLEDEFMKELMGE